MDIGELRRQILRELDHAKRESAERRAAADRAKSAYAAFLSEVAVPLVRQIATVLRAEGHLFTAFTPAETVRLVSDRASEDFIEIALDSEPLPPRIVVRTSVQRGRKGLIVSERPVGQEKTIDAISDQDVADGVLRELPRLLVK